MSKQENRTPKSCQLRTGKGLRLMFRHTFLVCRTRTGNGRIYAVFKNRSESPVQTDDKPRLVRGFRIKHLQNRTKNATIKSLKPQ
jgi:hypothetical protein